MQQGVVTLCSGDSCQRKHSGGTWLLERKILRNMYFTAEVNK